VTIETLNLLLVENADTLPLHFILELEDVWDQKTVIGWKNLHEVQHGMQQIKFHALLDIAPSPPKRGGSNRKPGDHDTSTPHNPCFIVT
jgi:hypothetical protein